MFNDESLLNSSSKIKCHEPPTPSGCTPLLVELVVVDPVVVDPVVVDPVVVDPVLVELVVVDPVLVVTEPVVPVLLGLVAVEVSVGLDPEAGMGQQL